MGGSLTLAAIWEELEARAPPGRAGRMVQRVHPESAVDLYVAVELDPSGTTTQRALELQTVAEVVAHVETPTGTRHVVQTVERRDDGRRALVLRLEDQGARDLFAAMCSDVASQAAARSSDEEAVIAWTARFAKWRRMFQAAANGLSQRRQLGLYAELLTIRDFLSPEVGIEEAILAWKGPDGAARDFELGGIAVEVKSSAANEPQIVPVHGERQLDNSGLDALVMVHHSLERLRDAGETLPGMVRELRTAAGGTAQGGTLEDRLIQSGYADVHAPLYRRTGYAVRRTSLFHVAEGFPRIVEGDLADGVGRVRYYLAIDACRDFETDNGALAETLRSNRAH